MKDKTLRGILFGDTNEMKKVTGRGGELVIPSLVGEPERRIEFRRSDGFIIELIKRIESLESKIEDLRNVKSKS